MANCVLLKQSEESSDRTGKPEYYAVKHLWLSYHLHPDIAEDAGIIAAARNTNNPTIDRELVLQGVGEYLLVDPESLVVIKRTVAFTIS